MKSIKSLPNPSHQKCSLTVTKKFLKELIDGINFRSQHPKIIVGKLSQPIFTTHRSLNQ